MHFAALLFAALLALPVGVRAATDANTADAAALERIRGIGPAIAARIVAARRDGGPFRDLDDLRDRVRGVGEANAKKMAAAGLAVAAGGGAITEAGSGSGRIAEVAGAAGCGGSGVEFIVGNGRLPTAQRDRVASPGAAQPLR